MYQNPTIPELYDAVLKKGGWQQLLSTVVRACGAEAGWLALHQPAAAETKLCAVHGVDAATARGYWTGEGPGTALVAAAISGHWSRTDERHGVLRRFLDAAGLSDAIGVWIEAENAVGAVALAHGTSFSDDGRGALADLAPHIERAARICARRERLEAEQTAASVALDLLRVGVLLLTSEGRVTRSNRAARNALAGGGLTIRGDALRCVNAMMSSRFDAALLEASGHGITIPRPGLPALLLEIHAVPASTGRIIYLRDPAITELPTPETLRRIHGFSKAEAQLAVALARGQTLRLYAERQGLTESYIKKLSKRALGRVGAANRADLVRLVLSSVI